MTETDRRIVAECWTCIDRYARDMRSCRCSQCQSVSSRFKGTFHHPTMLSLVLSRRHREHGHDVRDVPGPAGD